MYNVEASYSWAGGHGRLFIFLMCRYL